MVLLKFYSWALSQVLRYFILPIMVLFGDISLSSTSSSLVLHFKNRRFEELQKGQTLHTIEITALLSKDKLPDRPNAGLNINTQQTVPIHDILTTTEPGRFNSTVKGRLLRTNQNFLYLCCDHCYCLTSAEYGCLFECRSCHLNKIAIPRNIKRQKYQEETSFVHNLINSRLEDMRLQIEIQSKTFLKQDENTILSYNVQLLDCQKTSPLHACTYGFTEQPSSSSGITYLVPAEITNPVENLFTSTQAPPDLLHAAHYSPDNTETAIKLLSKKIKNTQHSMFNISPCIITI